MIGGRFNAFIKKAYHEAYEAEHHVHNRELWFGVAAAPDAGINEGDSDVMTPYQCDAGNDTWGAWVALLGSTDTPEQTNKKFFDPHRIIIAAAETDKTATRLQYGFGTSGSQVVLSEILFYPACLRRIFRLASRSARVLHKLVLLA